MCLLRGVRPGGRVRLSDLHFQAFVLRQTASVRQDPRRTRIKEYARYQLAWDLALLLSDPDAMRQDGRRLVLHEASATASRSRTTAVRVDRHPGEPVWFAHASFEPIGPGR